MGRDKISKIVYTQEIKNLEVKNKNQRAKLNYNYTLYIGHRPKVFNKKYSKLKEKGIFKGKNSMLNNEFIEHIYIFITFRFYSKCIFK